jgi:hypothetical protein
VDIDFSGVKNTNDFVTVPPGTYVCKVAEAHPGTTRSGDDRWALRLVVAEGEYTGRQVAWDGLVFSRRGMVRVRRVFAAFGLPTEGKVRVEPDDLCGRAALVEVRPAQYHHADTRELIKTNEVPYDGYRALPDGGGGRERPDDNGDALAVPF